MEKSGIDCIFSIQHHIGCMYLFIPAPYNIGCVLKERLGICPSPCIDLYCLSPVSPLVCIPYGARSRNYNHNFLTRPPVPGADPEISERGGGGRKPNSRKGSQNSTFQCSFQSFSYKSLTNIPPKGGAVARPAPPLNPHLSTQAIQEQNLRLE